MLLDRLLQLVVRNFSTLFLVVFVVIVPLHLVYGLFFLDVFAVRELHPAIANFPESRLVRGVGRSDVAQARIWFWVVAGVELLLVPLIVRAIRRVLELDHEGRVPDAISAWKTAGSHTGLDAPRPAMSSVAALGVAGLLVGGLTWFALDALVELLPDGMVGLGASLADAASRAAGASFALVGWALHSARPPASRELKL